MAWKIRKPEDDKELVENILLRYRNGCFNEKKPEDCNTLGRFTEMLKGDFSKAAAFYRSTCDDYHHGPSCLNFAQSSTFGRGVSKDLLRAFEYLEKGCNLGESESCRLAGVACIPDLRPYRQIFVSTNYLRGLHFFEKGCALEDAESCYMAGGLYLTGVPQIIDEDIASAFHYDLKACMLGNTTACANLSGEFSALAPTKNGSITGTQESEKPVCNGLEWRMNQLAEQILISSDFKHIEKVLLK